MKLPSNIEYDEPSLDPRRIHHIARFLLISPHLARVCPTSSTFCTRENNIYVQGQASGIL
jgi:hypothetical protein